MSLISTAKVAPEGKVNYDDLKKMAWNIFIFTVPALIVFFSQLAAGVAPKEALLVAALALYGIIADFLKKLKQTP